MTTAAMRKRVNRAIRELEAIDSELRVVRDNGQKLDLVGAKEAAEVLGISQNAFLTSRSRGRMPEPIVTLASGPVWHREDIEALLD
jgi:hypothetical protein